MPSNLFSIFVWGAFTHNSGTSLPCQRAVSRQLKPERAENAWECLPQSPLQPLPLTNRSWSINTPVTVPQTRVSRVTSQEGAKMPFLGTLLNPIPLLGLITLLHCPIGFLWECLLVNHLYKNLYFLICFKGTQAKTMCFSFFLLCKVAHNDQQIEN